MQPTAHGNAGALRLMPDVRPTIDTPMKFGIRTPSLKKRISARTSLKRVARHSLGLKAPRGAGWLTNPKKAAYNRVYNRTTVGLGKGCLVVFAFLASVGMAVAFMAVAALRGGL